MSAKSPVIFKALLAVFTRAPFLPATLANAEFYVALNGDDSTAGSSNVLSGRAVPGMPGRGQPRVECELPAQNHMARNNVFIAADDAGMGFQKCSGYTLERNVVYAPGGSNIANIDAVTTRSKNLFYSRLGIIKGITQKDGSNTETVSGSKDDTANGDPLFENLKAGDYRYHVGAPAIRQGIPAPDGRHAGGIQTVTRHMNGNEVKNGAPLPDQLPLLRAWNFSPARCVGNPLTISRFRLPSGRTKYRVSGRTVRTNNSI